MMSVAPDRVRSHEYARVSLLDSAHEVQLSGGTLDPDGQDFARRPSKGKKRLRPPPEVASLTDLHGAPGCLSDWLLLSQSRECAVRTTMCGDVPRGVREWRWRLTDDIGLQTSLIQNASLCDAADGRQSGQQSV